MVKIAFSKEHPAFNLLGQSVCQYCGKIIYVDKDSVILLFFLLCTFVYPWFCAPLLIYVIILVILFF